MSSSKKPKSQSKPPKSRPLTTSVISQPTSGHTSVLSSFSPDGTFFIIITLAIDKHRLRLYNTSTARVVAEHTFESSRVSALTWGSIKIDKEVLDTPNKKRKKRKTNDDTPQNEKQCTADTVDVVALGLEDGTVVFFSPTTSRIVRTLTHSSNASSIIALALKTVDTSILWTSSTDGIVRLWDVQKHEILSSWHDEEHIPYTSLSLRPTSNSSQTDLLVGHHRIRLFSDTTLHDPTQGTPMQLKSFTGHASSIMILRWAHASSVSHRFFSAAVSDRFVYVWDAVEDSSLGDKKPVACVALDSDVRTIGLSLSDLSRQTLVTLSVSGKLSFIPIPESLVPPTSTREATNKMVSLLPRSAVASSSKTHPPDPIIIDIICVPGDSQSIRIARLIKGVKPVFEDVRYLDDNGNFIQNISLEPIEEKDWDSAVQSVQTKRYVEPAPLGLASGLDIDRAETNDDAEMQAEIDGSLQVDLAELSLGQRLKAVSQKGLDLTSDVDDDTSSKIQTKPLKKQTGSEIPVVAANSLTRTLIQALHSSDTRLLEMCLTHSDPTLIRNTVRRLPPQLAIPLITSCVERLGRGNRANNMKGGGGGASSQRGSSLVAWVKTVLVIHAGHLMTIPDLVTRLSGLHATLTTRLNLHDSLLSLSGRLDMVLSQIESRSSVAPATLTSPAEGGKTHKKSTVTQYIEGESDSSNEEDAIVVVETEHEGVDGIEEVELDGSSENSGEIPSESEDDGEGMVFNPFVDDEAEEEYSDEENEDDSE